MASTLVNLVMAILQYGLVFYVASLSGDFVRLRAARIKNEAINDKVDRERLEMMQRNIEKKVEERAGEIKAGNNAIIIVNSLTGNVDQTIVMKQELRDPLALLVAYAEDSGQAEAIDASKKIVAQASKTTPDKTEVFRLWNTIVSAISKIADVVEIANAIIKIVGVA